MRKIGCPHVICDNGDDPNYYLDLCEQGVDAIRHQTSGRPEKRLAESWNLLRNIFLESDFQYMWLVEWDIYPPVDLIDELLIWAAPVMAVPYFTRDAQLCSQVYVNSNPPKIINCPTVPDSLFTTEVCSIHRQSDMIPTGMGTGCLLLKRNVVEQMTFTWIEQFPEVAPDVWLWYWLLDKGMPCLIYNKHIVEHRHKSWMEVLNN